MAGSFDEAGDEYRAEQKVRRRNLIIQASIGLLVLIAACALLYWYDRTYNLTAEERFEKELGTNESVEAALKPIRLKFPYEYKRLRKETAESYNLEKSGKVLDHLPAGYMGLFMKRHAFEALQGGDKEAFAFVDSYADMMTLAIKDDSVCQILMGNEQKFTDTPLIFSKKPIAQMFASFVSLAAAGRDSPVTRTPVSKAELSDYYRDLFELRKVIGDDRPQQVAKTRCENEKRFVDALKGREPSRRILFISSYLQMLR